MWVVFRLLFLITVIGFLFVPRQGAAAESSSSTIAGATDPEEESRQILRDIIQAYADRDYQRAYRILRAHSDEDRDAIQWTGLLLLGALEMEREHDPSSDKWYRSDLMATIPRSERDRVGIEWVRRAAYLEVSGAMNYMASTYKWGWHGLPVDRELSQCFAEARKKLDEKTHLASQKLADCQQLEMAKGYAAQ